MKLRNLCFVVLLGSFLALSPFLAPNAQAQQTLGGITGTVTDASGAVISGATVNLLGDETKLSRTQTTNANGSYLFVNLPIGSYTLSFTQPGFQGETVPSILVQANRTATVSVQLKVGNVSESITVEETPLLNQVDTTNGYVLDKLQIDAVPLPTGSFTGLAILSPGVSAELSSGTGANAGLGNAPVWANGQRDTSNTFLMNGVSAYSLFNGKSTSEVNSARVVNNTGIGTTAALSSVPIQSSASVYLAIGESIPSPAPETISELRVNTSMYDAQQGATSGAHIDMSTASGTNNIHGSAYVHRGTNWLNADPYFFNADPNIPANEKNPSLHRYTAGGTIGLPIKKDKLFFYAGYQHTHASDEEIGISRAYVPLGLGTGPAGGAACATRSAQCLAAIANADTMAPSLFLTDPCVLPQIGTAFTPNVATPCGFTGTSAQVNPIAYALFNYKLPNGQYLIPNASTNSVFGNPGAFSSNPAVQSALVEAFPEDAEVPGTAYFLTNQAVANLDWNPNSAHSFSGKYYYQQDPTIAPYAYSQVAGFAQHLDAGSQVIALSHTQIVKSNLSITEIFGFIREKAYSTMNQPFTPQQFASFAATLPEVQSALMSNAITPDDLLIHNLSGSSVFPGIGVVWAGAVGNAILPSYPYSLMIGQGSAGQGAFTGVFQNRFNPSANAIWTRGRHTITFGGSFGYTQMSTRDRRDQIGSIASEDVTQFLAGVLIDDYSYNITATINGNANRYWRARETGEYIQDKFQWRPNLTITAGLRFDWNGGLTEKNGDLLNFDPSKYSYDPTTDTLKSNGLLIAGNNPKFATPGVSATTLTGRQWGLAPRLGVAWSPKMFNSKLVVRAGWGIYYDRGELYAYLSPGLTQNITNGGPFGINQQAPFVSTQFCPTSFPGPFNLCDPTQLPQHNGHGNQLAYPWGVPPGIQPTGDPTSVVPPTTAPSFCGGVNGAATLSPQNIGAYIACGAPPFYLGAYARNNKLPYTLNSTLDIQWQPRNDLAIDIGYVNGLGRHEVIPIPFNQSRIASPGHPLCGPAPVCANPNGSAVVTGGATLTQYYTYGYTVQSGAPGSSATCPNVFNPCAIPLPAGPGGQNLGPMMLNSEGGNVDLRVPYIGYGAESEIYTAEGISAYNALQAHVEKRLSHGLQAGVSYTFSRSLDEQSALGLFYNGNNPLNIRDGYGPSDFDRTHIINIDYHYELPKFFRPASWEGKVGNGWGIQGLVILQSGQPYSMIDYSGAVGSVFYSIYDGITNPIVPLNFAKGCTPQNALTGATGATPGVPALKASCFTVPLLNPGDLNGAIPAGDTYETNFTTGQRNIFRQPWQKRADLSLFKITALTERFSLKYTFDVYNLTNHPSFDIPIDNVTQNLAFSQTPVQGTNPLPNSCPGPSNSPFYACPTGLGQVVHTIGSARQIQMTLGLSF